MDICFGGGRFGTAGKILPPLLVMLNPVLPIQEKCTPVLLLTLPHFMSDHQVCGAFFHTSRNSS